MEYAPIDRSLQVAARDGSVCKGSDRQTLKGVPEADPMMTAGDTNLCIQKYLARQPIFDRHESVFGYELLFRSGLDNFFQPQFGENATEYVVDNYLLLGIEALTGGRKAFINFTRESLVKDYPTLLPTDQVVVEILEDIHPDEEILAACRRLKQAGYLIALDDFIFAQNGNPLTGYADIIKVDFLATLPEERETLARRFSPLGVRMLAEKIETHGDVASALKMGYTYFQGYFFCKPQLLSTRDIPSFKLNYLRILRAINRQDVDLDEVEGILRQEPSLLYKLLRYINSAGFGLRGHVTSIRHALALLGERNLRKWTSVVALLDLAEDRPAELIVTALVRARFCELLAPLIGLRQQETDLFLLGLFSVMDVVLGRDIKDVLAEMPLTEEVKAALLGKDNRFRCVLDSAMAREQGDWHRFRSWLDRVGIDEEQFPDAYLGAVQWVRQIFEV